MARRTLLVISAILVAAIGTALVWYYVQSADARARAGMATVEVFVPTAALSPDTPAATALAGSTLKTLQISGVGADPVTTANRKLIEGKVLTVPVVAGSALLVSMFDAPGSAASSAGLNPDKLAIEVSLADPNRVAGLLHPGSEVTIFAATGSTAVAATADKAEEKKVWILEKKVKVLSGSSTTPQQAGTDGVPTANVVLEVDQTQAARIILTQAGDKGTVLWFALRGSDDVQLRGKDIITGQDLLKVTP